MSFLEVLAGVSFLVVVTMIGFGGLLLLVWGLMEIGYSRWWWTVLRFISGLAVIILIFTVVIWGSSNV